MGCIQAGFRRQREYRYRHYVQAEIVEIIADDNPYSDRWGYAWKEMSTHIEHSISDDYYLVHFADRRRQPLSKRFIYDGTGRLATVKAIALGYDRALIRENSLFHTGKFVHFNPDQWTEEMTSLAICFSGMTRRELEQTMADRQGGFTLGRGKRARRLAWN